MNRSISIYRWKPTWCNFGADRDLAEVTEADAEDFKMFLVAQKLAPTSVSKRLQFARMFFRAAKKRNLIADNPFAEVSAKAVMRQDRQRFITREETDRLLAVCNPTWRIIVALVVSRDASKPRNRTGQGIPDPRCNRVAWEYSPHCLEALLASD